MEETRGVSESERVWETVTVGLGHEEGLVRDGDTVREVQSVVERDLVTHRVIETVMEYVGEGDWLGVAVDFREEEIHRDVESERVTEKECVPDMDCVVDTVCDILSVAQRVEDALSLRDFVTLMEVVSVFDTQRELDTL